MQVKDIFNQNTDGVLFEIGGKIADTDLLLIDCGGLMFTQPVAYWRTSIGNKDFGAA
jgi:hypothetical protein